MDFKIYTDIKKEELVNGMPKMVVMQPTVVNVSSENVASEEIGHDSEQGVILQKIDSFDFDNREDDK
jgi:hypothetical protein